MQKSLEPGSKKGVGQDTLEHGYFYESVGRVTSETIKYYIERRERRHWAEQDYEVQKHLKGQTKLGDFCN